MIMKTCFSSMKVLLLCVSISSVLASSLNVRQRREAGANPTFPLNLPGFPQNFFNSLNYSPLPNLPSHPNPPSNFYDDYYNHPNSPYHPSENKCVKPYDLNAELALLSYSADAYPLADIEAEKAARLDLVGYLPSAPAVLPDQSHYTVDPSYSCPTMRRRLRSFTRHGGQCWILDEMVVDYGYCMNAYCSNSHYGSGVFTRNMCMEHFDTVHVWAYCDSYADATRRIRQETIRLPKYCSCKTVRCY